MSIARDLRLGLRSGARLVGQILVLEIMALTIAGVAIGIVELAS